MSDEYYWGPNVRMEPPDPPTDPPEEPRREDGPCELCCWYSPLCDIEGERVGVPGYEAPGVCTQDEGYPTLVDGAKDSAELDCDAFERRVR